MFVFGGLGGNFPLAVTIHPFSVAKATLELQMSISQSVTKTPQPLRIKSFCHYAYLLISQIPISHHAIISIGYLTCFRYF